MGGVRLVSVDGKIKHPLDEAMMVIGRSKTADLRLNHASVSGRHCQISRVNQYYAIHDLGSRNGTRVNGSRISQAYLSPGDYIQVGEVVLRFESEVDLKTSPLTLGEASGGKVEDGLIVAMERISVQAESSHYYRHTDLVVSLALDLARELSLDAANVSSLRLAAVMMDQGMLRVPSDILRKKGSLTPEETAEVERHPIYSVESVADLGFSKETLAAIRGHHERWDGKGYPDRLAREKIPFLARVLSLAQAAAAMLSIRPHRPKASPADVAKEIERNAGTQFDPKLVPVMVKVLSRMAKP